MTVPTVRQGEALSAGGYNELRRRACRKFLGPGVLETQDYVMIRPPPVETQEVVARFGVFSEIVPGGDVIRVTPSNFKGVLLGQNDVFAFMPAALRRSTLDGKTRRGITYQYTTDTERFASIGLDTQREVRITSYQSGDIMRLFPIEGENVTIDGQIEAVNLMAEAEGNQWGSLHAQ